MATENLGKRISLLAAADYSLKQFYLLKMDTTDSQGVLAGAGDPAIGVLQDAPTAGEPGEVALGGHSKVAYGGTITAGDLLASDANGAAVVAVTGNYIVGVAKVSGVVGDVGEMIIKNIGVHP